MSEAPKLPASRSAKIISKTRYEFWAWDENYDWLFHKAQAEGITMSRKLNELLAFLRVFHGE